MMSRSVAWLADTLLGYRKRRETVLRRLRASSQSLPLEVPGRSSMHSPDIRCSGHYNSSSKSTIPG